jgi:hypothetical protein
MATWQVLDLGTASYRDVWATQIGLVEQRQADRVPATARAACGAALRRSALGNE